MELFPDGQTFLKIGPLSIQLYAVCIILGAYIAYRVSVHTLTKLGYNEEVLSDCFFGVLFVGILGARVWYVIFKFNDLYRDNLIDIIMFRNGGLAIQGGVVAGIAFCYWFFKKHDIEFFVAADAILPTVLIAQAFGRWGNFFNQEAYGSAVSLDFLQGLHLPQFIIDKMYIQGQYYHPTFLYESIANIIGFLLIYFVIKKFQSKQGTLFFSYFIWYGITRFFIEGLRMDSLYFMGLRTAQVTSIVFVIVGIIGVFWCYKKGKTIKTV